MNDILKNRVKVGDTPTIDCETARKVQNDEIDADELLKAATELHTLSCEKCLKKYTREQQDAET